MSGRAGRSNAWRFSTGPPLGSRAKRQWPQAHAVCSITQSGSATCRNVSPLWPFCRRSLARANAQAAGNARLLRRAVARRRLGAVGTVLPELPAKVRHFSLQRRDLASQRGDQLLDFGRMNDRNVDSDSLFAVFKNRPSKDLFYPVVTFRTYPVLGVTSFVTPKPPPSHGVCPVKLDHFCIVHAPRLDPKREPVSSMQP